MADEEAEQDRGPDSRINIKIEELRLRLQQLEQDLVDKRSESPVQSSAEYCQEFCTTLLEYAGTWRTEDEPLPLVEVYIVALLSYAQASPYLSLECENVLLVIERLSLSFVELLLSVKKEIPDGLWKKFKLSVQFAYSKLEEHGVTQLSLLSALAHYDGVWTNRTLQGLISKEDLPTEQVEEFLVQDGLVLLEMRVKQLMKDNLLGEAALLAKTCSQCPAFQGKGPFKQMYLVCLCATSEQAQLMDELSTEDCRDALEMICNLESEGNEMAALSLCSAFLTRQLLQGDTYCAWELTLFWSKLLKRLEPSEQTFLDRCRQMSLLSKTVYHILFLIKVIQSEVDTVGLPVCIEMCIRALQIESGDGGTKASVCKTISCLLSSDLEVKRACQLTEFLLEPTVDSYYAVETLYNEPDQKLEEENMPVPNSLRCELLLVFKTQWPFDPEFWDWKTLKRHCLALMGEEASIVSSIDLLNDTEEPEEEDNLLSQDSFNNTPDHLLSSSYKLKDITDKKQKNREMKKLREKGFISTRFRNWQAYMQYCVLCDKEFLGHRIVRHAQTHLSGGVYSCPICAQTFASKDSLIPHVTSHVKQSSKERLTAMKTNKKLANPQMAAPVIAALKIKTENELHDNADSSGQSPVIQNVQAKATKAVLEVSDYSVCPVGKCKRSFKFFKNLVAHVKDHGDNEEAKTFLEMRNKKVVCQYCRRHFINVTHLNDHLQVHCGAKPYICIQLNCKASFLSNTELLLHRKTHSAFKARCLFPNCGKIFSEAFRLYDHEAQHYKTFTCKSLDCGKVFHSQEQLKLHEEKHTTPKKETPPSERILQDTNPGPSLIEQMLSNNPPLKQEPSQENWSSESSVNPCHERLPTSIESLQKSSQTHVETSVDLKQHQANHHKIPLSTNHSQSLNNSVVQPVSSHLSDMNRHMDGSGDLASDYMMPTNQHQTAHANLGNVSHSIAGSDGQLQMFLSTANNGSLSYSSDRNLPLPGQQGPMSSSNLLAVPQLQNSTKPAMSQPLPPTVNSQPPSVRTPEKCVTSLTSTGPPPGHRERFHCAFETCSRHYSSSRSVNKHMKAVHPDFYEQWKVARTKIKITYAPAPSKPSAAQFSSVASFQTQIDNRIPVVLIKRENVIQSPPYSYPGTGTKHSTQNLPKSSSDHNQKTSFMMENVLKPNVDPQLRSDINLCSQNWQQPSGNDLVQNCVSSQGCSSNMQAVPQIDTTSATLPLNISSCSVMESTMNRSVESLQSQLKEGESYLPSYMNSVKKDRLPCKSQVQRSLMSTAAEKPVKSMQSHVRGNYPSLNGANQNQSKSDPAVSQNSSVNQMKIRTKRSSRTKCPAILRNGKFICRRCFREFDNPKSLGGHLSKRSLCKPFDESLLNTDLPASFLDLLKSEQTDGNAQPQLSSNPAPVYQDKPHQSVNSSAPAKDFLTPNYQQDNLPLYSNSETNDDILKQIIAESNMSDLFGHTHAHQPLFPNLCAPYGADEHLPGTSVIQYTENTQVKQETSSYAIPHHPQPSVNAFSGSEFPDPLLSQILTENPSIAVSGSVPINHGGGYYSKTTIQTPDMACNPVAQTLLPNHCSQTGGSQAETQMTKTTQAIKKRLQEQIFAGNFQRRNSLLHSRNPNQNASSHKTMSFGQVSSPSRSCGLPQMLSDAKIGSAVEGQAIQDNPAITPGESDQLSAPSFFGFRDPFTPQQELPSPPGFVGNDDLEPTQLSVGQQQWLTEIQTAFERLDLVREVSDQISASMLPKDNTLILPTGNPNPKSEKDSATLDLINSIFIKPFVCDCENCTFSSMSSDSLWKHLSKTHSYTVEMVNAIKKKYGQYAPFKCQRCIKAFTRNSNLRNHYITAHKLSSEEIAGLDEKHKPAKTAASTSAQKVRPVQTTVASRLASENRSHVYHCHEVKHACPSQAMEQHAKPKFQRDTCDSVTQLVQTASPQVNGHPSLSSSSALNMQTTVKTGPEINKKTKEKKASSGDPTSPYRPYRCVHQGCIAAFTIQHNLILHYRAVHHTALSALEVNKGHDQNEGLDEAMDHNEEVPEADIPQLSEFRCEVKDCSRVFQEVSNLLQHYLRLHEFSLDTVGNLLSGNKLGKFTCGHQGCTATFTAFWKYVGHVREQHKDMKLVKPEHLNGTFKCEIEGCDRSYATKSNLLRHVMKKHQDLYQPKLKTQEIKEEMKQNSKTLHYQINQMIKTSNGKENIESNKKVLQRQNDTKRGRKPKNHWSKYGKPSLKSKVEASAMCTKKFHLQYPCMIKGCESVMKSERSILKHYIGHGLSEKYLEQQRCNFIFCKKFPRQKCRSIRSDDSKSENTSDPSDNEATVDTCLDRTEYDPSKPVLRKRATVEIPAAVFDSKISHEESSDGSVVLKRKRGRPRKLIGKIEKRKKIPRTTKMAVVYSRDDESDSSCPAVIQGEVTEQSAPLATFKPMGFEVSFLKFLEQKNNCEHPLMRAVAVPETCKKTNAVNTKDTCVRFSNQQNLKSLSKVKIIVDGAFSGVTDFMLKQLQDMHPTVVLEKNC